MRQVLVLVILCLLFVSESLLLLSLPSRQKVSRTVYYNVNASQFRMSLPVKHFKHHRRVSL